MYTTLSTIASNGPVSWITHLYLGGKWEDRIGHIGQNNGFMHITSCDVNFVFIIRPRAIGEQKYHVGKKPQVRIPLQLH